MNRHTNNTIVFALVSALFLLSQLGCQQEVDEEALAQRLEEQLTPKIRAEIKEELRKELEASIDRKIDTRLGIASPTQPGETDGDSMEETNGQPIARKDDGPVGTDVPPDEKPPATDLPSKKKRRVDAPPVDAPPVDAPPVEQPNQDPQGLLLPVHVIAKGVGEDRNPIEPGDLFTTEAGTVWCYIEADNREGPKRKLTFVWYLNDTERHRYTLDVGKSPKWRTWAKANISPGEWRCDIFNESGLLLSRAPFNVVAVPE